MAEIRLSPAARRDFLEIGDYPRDRWSEVQAERYLKQILAMIAGTHPFAGKEEASVRSGYRRRRSGSHLIFYVVLEDGMVEIISILHERAGVSRLLDD
ncbi:hypothetical protein ASE36_04410 [Rhizobium sp. Root274]|uniref:type II toxin-antitoxin system RelE/ParE family toxin n=1 Tax=unclassified Rhizobium TaxID=2613769 RepID=UPI0007159AA6|nr:MULTISPECIES: type II toxin-antitoxin system RelE/ParE family toxin [unclassified Rhizobium]KQW31494.1 hypothetical protein ASC71_04415 [Rhizobium sp. Root1240]KRD33036.1 hypothetical protein ASE36_04410 [Rhizobium sp. Root274]